MASVIVLVICFDGWCIDFWCLFSCWWWFAAFVFGHIFRTLQELSFRFWCLICPSKLNAELHRLQGNCGQPMNYSLAYLGMVYACLCHKIMVRWWRLGIVDVMWKWQNATSGRAPKSVRTTVRGCASTTTNVLSVAGVQPELSGWAHGGLATDGS